MTRDPKQDSTPDGATKPDPTASLPGRGSATGRFRASTVEERAAAGTASMRAEAHTEGVQGSLLKLSLGALGVVYGDIGTSPLYALKECFNPQYGLAPTADNVVGILSLVLWALILVVVVKYLSFIMRADNHGEGGILALFALVMPQAGKAAEKRVRALMVLGLFGAALLFGDGIITPAISVLSAVEGLEVATASLRPYVVPLTVVILIGLFLVQRKGTTRIGKVFGPAMLVWFTAIGALGLPAILRAPAVLGAINPRRGLELVTQHGRFGFLVLGAVVLAITGGEALYADMGHFGRRSIRVAWYAVVLPGLLLNYLGQGALLMTSGASVVSNPFFGLAPGWTLLPMVAISTVATVIASQALISGVFSLTHQAVQLGYWPRVAIIHTSDEAEGQIYVPEMNWALMLGCVALVLGFRESSKLAAAYGIAVTGTMSITSILFYQVARRRWGWPRWQAAGLVGLFLVVDLSFFLANAHKILEGGWFPIVVAIGVYTIMSTWKLGRSELGKSVKLATLPLDLFMMDVETSNPTRVRGTAVVMTPLQDGVPLVLLHHFKHNKVLHQQVVLLSIVTERVPVVSGADRVQLENLGSGFWRVVARYGFMQQPQTLKTLRRCALKGLRVDPDDTTFFLGRETLLPTGPSPMAKWRKRLFIVLSRNSRPATEFFGLPPNRVVEMGAQIEL